jgi:hypothetical protein
MDILAFIVLEDALNKLAKRPARPDVHSRLDECVTVVRACMYLIALNPADYNYTNKIRIALTELAVIARRDGELSIAGKLKIVVHRLNSTQDIQKHTFAQVA